MAVRINKSLFPECSLPAATTKYRPLIPVTQSMGKSRVCLGRITILEKKGQWPCGGALVLRELVRYHNHASLYPIFVRNRHSSSPEFECKAETWRSHKWRESRNIGLPLLLAAVG
ncbi:predicted protein [Histoplasma capsulatum var. duboisii H88]|uniref:Predicted protein n=2 Tax=Ajellomyces capsulatus TaxID=5037 RepID=F0UTR3_AJEC8|nr:predicted protein [Histoplasma capsulatum H143]EGC49290.1 predicted protein [Histoplasma capsulatum var. duboisii H88]